MRDLPPISTCGFHFEKTNPKLNSSKYYSGSFSCDLFGQGTLVIRWGRLGMTHNVKCASSGTEDELWAAATRLMTERLDHGYRLVSFIGPKNIERYLKEYSAPKRNQDEQSPTLVPGGKRLPEASHVYTVECLREILLSVLHRHSIVRELEDAWSTMDASIHKKAPVRDADGQPELFPEMKRSAGYDSMTGRSLSMAARKSVANDVLEALLFDDPALVRTLRAHLKAADQLLDDDKIVRFPSAVSAALSMSVLELGANAEHVLKGDPESFEALLQELFDAGYRRIGNLVGVHISAIRRATSISYEELQLIDRVMRDQFGFGLGRQAFSVQPVKRA